jgi:hypothetical protein
LAGSLKHGGYLDDGLAGLEQVVQFLFLVGGPPPEAAIDAAADVEREAACALLEAGPRTMAGVIALLSYAHVADTDGMGWPDDLDFNDNPLGTRSWHYFLIENLLEILPRFVLA